MIRRQVRFPALLLAILALALGAMPARAQLVDEEGVGRLTIGGGLGFQITSMSDVNDNFTVVNRALTLAGMRSVDNVKAGVVTNLDVRYKLGQTPPEEPGEPVPFMKRLSIGFAWGAINARSGFETTRAGTRFFTRSTTYYPYVLYHFPFLEDVAPRTSVYAGGGPLFLRAGTVEWSLKDMTINNFLPGPEGDLAEFSGKGKAKGSGTGLVLMGGGSFQLNQRFSIALDAGYRLAKLANVELQEAVGDTERFPGSDVPGQTVIREPGDWAIIDFFMRDPNAVWDGRKRTDPKEQGGCSENGNPCPMYYGGGPLEVNYSGLFATLSFRVHFF
jgi:hypothetical protein